MLRRNINGTIDIVTLRGRGNTLFKEQTFKAVDKITVYYYEARKRMLLAPKYLQSLQPRWLDGRYTFETRLVDIPGVDVNFMNSSMTEVATLADLLDHGMGLSSITDYGFIAGYPPQADRKFITGKTKYVPEMQTPRTTMLYSNMMYMVLGHVIEVLGGDTWENLMSIRVFKPLRMTSARIIKAPEDVLREDVANPYILKDGQFFNSDPGVYVMAPLEPAGCVFATGPDMALWMDFMLNNGTTSEGVTLLREEDLLAIRQKHINLSLSTTLLNLVPPRFPVTDERDGYGFAWFTGHKRVSHSGGYFSYISLEWLFPDEKFGVFASVNGPGLPSVSSQGLQAILSYVTDLALDIAPWLNLTTGCTFPAPWRKPFSFHIDPPEILTNDNIEDFTGMYGNALLPDITIHVNTSHDKRQILWLEMNKLQGELFPTTSNDSFTFKMVLPWEYAIERVLNENFTIQYPTDFFRDPIKGQVLGFNITLSGKNDVMTYRKCARFLNENACEETPDPISGCDCSTKCCFWVS
ncbi:PBP4-like protein [Mya arenaria]|uniref:PBP4-like protein n=1 Tax=Mya arenaria TaxID=6604 RepID=A0ABY7FCU2_MYAAR|nr:PBP4-like protein [Mya arenaria]